MMRHHLKYLGFKFHLNQFINRLNTNEITYFAIAYTLLYISLIMVTITSHIFINIFQTVHFSAVKFTKGNVKNMSFLLIPKSPKAWEKPEAIGPGT